MNSPIISANISADTWKGAVGKFYYHHIGKMQYAVTYGKTGPVVGRERHFNDAMQHAKWFYDIEKSGSEYFSKILAERIEAYS